MNIVIHDPRISYKVGGSEIRHLQIAEYLSRKGCKVTILTQRKPFSPLFQQLFENNKHIEYIFAGSISMVTDSNFKSQDKEVNEAMAFTFFANGIYSSGNYDLIITSFIPDLVNLHTNIKKAVFFAGLPPTKEIASQEESYLMIADKIICISSFMKAEFSKFYPNIPQSKVVTIENGVSDRFLESKNNPVIKSDTKIYYSGRLIERKGIQDVLKAIKLLQKDNLFMEFIIAGEGDFKDNLIGISANLGIQDRVHFIGMRTQQEILEIADHSNFFVYTVTKPEGFGISPLEALARRCKVITTGLGGLGDYLNESNSIIVAPNDPGQIAESLRSVIADKKKYSQMTERGLKTARKYSMNNVLERYFNIFHEITNG